MGKKEHKWSLTYKDVFSYERLIAMILDWLQTEGYVQDDKYMESYYMEKRTASGREILFWWNGKKEGTNKYFERVIKLDFKTSGLNKVELIKEGQKIKAEKGELTISMNGLLLYGEDTEAFKTNEKSLMKQLTKIFESKIYADKIGEENKKFAEDLETLRLAIKQYLDTKGFIQDFKSFHPQYPY